MLYQQRKRYKGVEFYQEGLETLIKEEFSEDNLDKKTLMFYLGSLMYPRDSQKFVNHIRPDNITPKQAKA